MDNIKSTYQKISLEFYEKLKESCKECDGQGIINTSPRTFVDCKCTKIFLKLKEYIKHGVSIAYLIGDYKKEKEIFDETNIIRINKLIKFIIKLNPLHLSGSVFVSTKDNNSECTSIVANKVCKYLLELDRSVIIIKGIDLIRSLSSYDTTDSINQELNAYKYLIIDNFPVEFNKFLIDKASFAHNMLMQFFSYRLSTNMRTIICCDSNLDTLNKQYSDELFAFFQKNYLHCVLESKIGKKSSIHKVIQENPEYKDVFSDVKVEKVVKQKPSTNTRGKTLI